MCEQAGILYNILCGRPLQIWTDLCKECIIKLSTNSNLCFLDCYFHGCVKKKSTSILHSDQYRDNDKCYRDNVYL